MHALCERGAELGERGSGPGLRIKMDFNTKESKMLLNQMEWWHPGHAPGRNTIFVITEFQSKWGISKFCLTSDYLEVKIFQKHFYLRQQVAHIFCLFQSIEKQFKMEIEAMIARGDLTRGVITVLFQVNLKQRMLNT